MPKVSKKVSFKNMLYKSFITALYCFCMFIVVVVGFQVAMNVTAFVSGTTGVYQLSSASDVIILYVIIACSVGFTLFFCFKIINFLIKAMVKRIVAGIPVSQPEETKGE